MAGTSYGRRVSVPDISGMAPGRHAGASMPSAEVRAADDDLPRSPVAAPVLEMHGIDKRFGGVHALRGAELTVQRPGVVHGLLGQNGSGKSTLLGILSGQLRPDNGTILLGGTRTVFRSPLDALRSGIAMVVQETAIAKDLSVSENILLGRRLVRSPTGINWRRTHAKALEYLHLLGLDYDPRWPASKLRPDERQLVEIARALSMNARILILDEPTSSLTEDEVVHLFSAVQKLMQQGVSVIFVSHRIADLYSLGHEFTVLRDGKTVAQGPFVSIEPEKLVELMVGRKVASPQPKRANMRASSAPALALQGISVPGVLTSTDLEVGQGEIVGLAGLIGAGRSELLEAIFGIRPVGDGVLSVNGEPYKPGVPEEAIKRGIGYLPPDRKTQGLVLVRSVKENVMQVSTLGRSRLARPNRGEESRVVSQTMSALNIHAESPDVPVNTLSGGNQQKVALGKWLVAEPKVLLLDEPTRGVDVAAKQEIHEHLRRVARGGTALLVSSSETPELLALCDRVVVMFRGRVMGSLIGQQATEASVARLAGGEG